MLSHGLLTVIVPLGPKPSSNILMGVVLLLYRGHNQQWGSSSSPPSLPQELSTLLPYGPHADYHSISEIGSERKTFLYAMQSGVAGQYSNLGVLSPPYSKCDLWSSILGINWGFVRNAKSQHHPETMSPTSH